MGGNMNALTIMQGATVIDTRQRRQWQQMLAETFGAVDFDGALDHTPFFAQMSRRPLGSTVLARVKSSDEISRRTRRHIAKDGKESFIVVLVQEGILHLHQFERECVVQPGMLCMFDLNSPHTYMHSRKTDVLSISMPTVMLQSRLGDPRRFAATTRDATSGIGRVAADCLQSLARESGGIAEATADQCCAALVDMLGLAFQSRNGDIPAGESVARLALHRRCLAYIRDNISDPDIDPESIARGVGISVRYLHRVFQDSGESVGEFIRRCRLERCRQALTEPSSRDVRIGQIAQLAGFRSVAHFSNAFKLEFGMSPRDMRKRSTAADSN